MTEEIKIIDSGSFGCITLPSIKCDNTIGTPKYVSKIQKTEGLAMEKEIKIGKIIKKIPNYKMFFAPIISSCPINIGMIEEEELKKCNILKRNEKNIIDKKEKYQSNKIRYIGSKTLEDYIRTNIWNKELLIKEIANSHIYILNSVKKLVANGIIHYDLKENNILYDKKNKVPIIIDFGLSFKITENNNWKEIFYVYGSYEIWNIEEILLSYIFQEIHTKDLNKEITIEIIEKVIEEYIEGERSTYKLKIIENEKEKMKQKLKEYFKQFKGKLWNEITTTLLEEQNWKSWDNYSLSVVYLTIIDYYNIKISAKYISVLKENILALPGQRKGPEYTKNELVEIFENYIE